MHVLLKWQAGPCASTAQRRPLRPLRVACSRMCPVKAEPQASAAVAHLPSGSVAGNGQAFVAAPALDGAANVQLSRRGVLFAGTVGVQLWWQNDMLKALADQGITKVFVAGATGNTGRRVVQQLRAAGYEVRAGVRDPKKAQALGFGFDPKVSIVEADLTSDVSKLAAAIGDAQAVICAVGYSGFNPSGSTQVDEVGTKRLVDATKAAGAGKFVLVSSLLTNAAAVGQQNNPNYKFLNLLGGVLDKKLQAEKHLRQSGLDYTIVRPGGLSNEPESKVGNLIASGEDTLFGLDTDPGRAISRDTVAAVAVQALVQPTASNKVVEIVASPSAPLIPPEQWFP